MSNYLSKEISGSIFYSSKYLTNNSMGLADTISNIYKFTALLPTMPWKDAVPPNAPEELAAKRIDNVGVEVTWQLPTKLSRDKEEIQSFVLYRFEEGEDINLDNPQNIVSIIRNAGVLSFVDRVVSKRKAYNYIITSLDRLQNESSPSNKFYLK